LRTAADTDPGIERAGFIRAAHYDLPLMLAIIGADPIAR